jgi:hypothetical protein
VDVGRGHELVAGPSAPEAEEAQEPPWEGGPEGQAGSESLVLEDPEEAIRMIGAFCRDYCPVVHACVEERCRLWNIEQQAVAMINARTEEVGIVGVPTVGL